MTKTEEQTCKNILVGVDGSDQASLAYERTIEVARRNGSRVIVANILENQVYTMMGYSMLNDQLTDQEIAATEELMADCKKHAESVDFHNVETVTMFGSPKEVMSRELPEKYNVDLIMVGQSGSNAVEHVAMGGVSSYVIRQALCGALTVHSEEK